MAKKAQVATMFTTSEVHAAICRRYSAPGNGDRARYIVANEVSNATGSWRDRAADVLVLKCWPSDGVRLL